MIIIRRLLLILLHYEIFFCYSNWALRTTNKLPSTTTSQYNKQIKNDTEDHILPKKISFNKTRTKISSITTNCTRDTFEINIDLGTKKFRGILFAKDFAKEECRTFGNHENLITLKLPTNKCGVRSESKTDGSLEMSVKIMLQMDPKLRQSSDVIRIVKCKLPASMMSLELLVAKTAHNDWGMKKVYRNGRMRLPLPATKSSSDNDNQSETETTQIPRVRIWLELGGDSNSADSGFVEVGNNTTLTVRAVVPGSIGVRVVECSALDGLGDSSQKLIDQRGCPIDEQVMPALHTRVRPAEEGWSKPHQDDLVEKLYTTSFPAFKFPDRERLHVSCSVQLCKGKCPNVNCKSNDTNNDVIPPEKQLAKIEVFNSLAVSAPQIEIDPLRSERRYNMSVEEYPPRTRTSQHSDGVLCLSISNLALAFCFLGLIFLSGIVIAVCCLIRSKAKERSTNGSYRAGSTSLFSSSDSGQSARFGSKLLIPPYHATLPYGRVY